MRRSNPFQRVTTSKRLPTMMAQRRKARLKTHVADTQKLKSRDGSHPTTSPNRNLENDDASAAKAKTERQVVLKKQRLRSEHSQLVLLQNDVVPCSAVVVHVVQAMGEVAMVSPFTSCLQELHSGRTPPSRGPKSTEMVQSGVMQSK